MFRRVVLFLLVNALVILTISIILNVLDIRPYLSQSGLDYESLLTFCTIWGFTGALISLATSRLMAKWLMGVEVIDLDTQNPLERQLLATISTLSKKAGLPKMPEVGIYTSPEVNAFATGPSKSRALVAVSTGLLQRMDWAETEGVLGHEISHIANGDMVTMTLLQGVVNTFVMFFARIIAFAITRLGKSKEDSEVLPSPFLYSILVFAFEIIFMILGSLVIAAFSRFREFRADEGGAYLAGKRKMIQALQKLEQVTQIQDPKTSNAAFQSMKISTKSGLFLLFASHPPLAKRIERLEQISDV